MDRWFLCERVMLEAIMDFSASNLKNEAFG